MNTNLEKSYRSSDKLHEESSNDGTNKLSNPVKDAGEDGDLASKSQAEGHGRVHMATRNVCADGDRHKKSQGMSNCYCNESSRIKFRGSCQFGYKRNMQTPID